MWQNNLYKNIVLTSIDILNGTMIRQYYNTIKYMESKNEQFILEWQSENLKKIVKHFYDNSNYYKKKLDNLNVKPKDINTLEDIQKLPVLTKNELRENYGEIIPTNLDKFKYKKDATGGSTGDPLKYLLDFKSLSFNTAFNIYSWEKHGYFYGEPYLALGSSSLKIDTKINRKYKIYNKIRGRIPISALNLSENNIRIYVEIILKQKIKYLYGYASALYLIAKYIIKNKIFVNSINVCFPTSETLLPIYRNALIEAFNCKVVDCYGARDGGVSAYEIENNKYCVSYNCFLEIENTISNTGSLLTTDLLNYTFPFIRYKIGDEVTISNKQYPKFNGQILTHIDGRTPDVIYLENGNVLTGPGFTILFKDLNITAYQIEKVSKMHLLCRIVPNENFDNIEESIITQTIKKHAGNDCKVELEYLEKLPLLRNGKTKFFIT